MEFGFQRSYFQGVQASEQLAHALPFQMLLKHAYLGGIVQRRLPILLTASLSAASL
jgi:hypothetical protein